MVGTSEYRSASAPCSSTGMGLANAEASQHRRMLRAADHKEMDGTGGTAAGDSTTNTDHNRGQEQGSNGTGTFPTAALGTG